jgi:AcrR family transcriptional regulator
MTQHTIPVRPIEGSGRDRGRPRNPDVDDAIVQAALVVLAEVGYVGFTIAEVARRAGVGKPTVYRRWSHRSELVVEAMRSQMPGETGTPDGSVAEQLLDYTSRLWASLNTTPLGRVLPGLVAEMATDPALAANYRSLIIEPTRRLWRNAVERGIAAGALQAETDVDFVLDALAGPLYLPVLITGAPANPDAPRLAVQLVLARYGVVRSGASAPLDQPVRTGGAS